MRYKCLVAQRKVSKYVGNDVSIEETCKSDKFEHCIGMLWLKICIGRDINTQLSGKQRLSLGGILVAVEIK